MTIPVQVNGRVRFTIEVPAGADEVHIEHELRSTPALAVALAGKDLIRLVIVPGKIVNVVTR